MSRDALGYVVQRLHLDGLGRVRSGLKIYEKYPLAQVRPIIRQSCWAVLPPPPVGDRGQWQHYITLQRNTSRLPRTKPFRAPEKDIVTFHRVLWSMVDIDGGSILHSATFLIP